VARAVTDRGGWPTDEHIDRSGHEFADWELVVDALVASLIGSGVLNSDELRRAVETMSLEAYERAGYYERLLHALETLLGEKGIVLPGAIDARIAG
jgi:hypothetical protein